MSQIPPVVSSHQFIADHLHLLRQSLAAPAISAAPLTTALPSRDAKCPCVLLLSPHPDDECLTGILPLRLKREQNVQIISIAVTLGSNADRRAARKVELAQACALLGFNCVLSHEDGFSAVNAATRKDDPDAWLPMITRLAEIIAHFRPEVIFLPHAEDWNTTHIGTHLLGLDALALMPRDFTCSLIQTEYWQPILEPNLMIGVAENEASDLLSALTCHTGEVARNPYDRRFPAYLIDNVRRGSEHMGGKGAASADMDFAMLYKIGLWLNGKFVPSALKRFIGVNDSVGTLLE